MRLASEEIAAIRDAAAETFGDDAVVRLFGSRVDDAKRGGDIDLLIDVRDGMQGIEHESRFLDLLFRRIDERKIDIVFTIRGRAPSAFAAMVAQQAVELR